MSLEAFFTGLFKTEQAKPMELAAQLEVGTTRIGRDNRLYMVCMRNGRKVWKRLHF